MMGVFLTCRIQAAQLAYKRMAPRGLLSARPIAIMRPGLLRYLPNAQSRPFSCTLTTLKSKPTGTEIEPKANTGGADSAGPVPGTNSAGFAAKTAAGTTAASKSQQELTDKGSGGGEKLQRSAKSVWAEIRRLFCLARPEYATLAAALLCLVCTSTVTMLLPMIIGKIIDAARQSSDTETDAGPADGAAFGLTPEQFYGGLAALFAAGAVANYGRIYLLRLAGERLVARLRARLFAKILAQDASFFDGSPGSPGKTTGDLILRLASDTQMLSKAMSGNVSDGARALILGAVGLLMMCYVLWQLTLCMTLVFPPLIVMSTVYGRRIKKLARVIQDALGSLARVLEERLNGVRTIQSFAQQRAVLHGYDSEVRAVYTQLMLEGRASALYYSINGLLGNAMIVGLLGVGARLIAAGELSIGDLSSFMMYAVYTGSAVFGLSNFYTELMKGVGAAERVFELVDRRPRIHLSVGNKPNDLHGDIVFKDVSFTYPSRPDAPVFAHLNLTVRRGEHVCLVGPSGLGKSTVPQLLLRFYDADSGEIFVNGHRVRGLNANAFRRRVGYVQQEPVLFSGTIRDNVTFGRPNSTLQEMEQAARLSNCLGFITAFPDAWDTKVGPSASGGAQLSGGQKQRISLARTLLQRPDILILDEATSALDSRLEELVMKNLAGLSREGVTILLIAHRLSTIQNSERIIVLDGLGDVVEDGTFDKLIEDPQSNLNRILKTDEFAEEA